jgi:adenylate kinase
MKERFALKHISTGDLLREAAANGTWLGKKVESILASGELVSDDIVLELITEAVSVTGTNGNGQGWILDGFPRTMTQAEAVVELLQKQGNDIDAVVVLDVDRDAVIDRLSARRTCSNCKTVYHLIANPSKVDGKCDECDGEIIQREDDHAETIANRLDVYEAQTKPILGFFEGKYPIHRVDGSLSVDEVTQKIEQLVR